MVVILAREGPLGIVEGTTLTSSFVANSSAAGEAATKAACCILPLENATP